MKKFLTVFLTLLSVILLGTVIVLTTARSLFGVSYVDVILEPEMYRWERWASIPGGGVGEKGHPGEDKMIPKLIHQTWKNETIPEKYRDASRECREMHKDYEYKLWTDAMAREFIAENYDWFLPTFDGYQYNIERADAIRYFILHHYGGFYLDLDVGCKRSMDPLRYAPAILMQTIPVGVSNDIMASRKDHPFWEMVIHNLRTFDRNWGINYPTVMFSTGPMFISFQYRTWPYRHGIEHEGMTLEDSRENEVRVMTKRWYGKNLGKEDDTDAFWRHFYGSSWHEDDAGFITFLGKFGMVLMYIGTAVVVLGLLRVLYNKAKGKKSKPTSPRPLAFLPTNISLPSPPEGSNGMLYYLPVWLTPNSNNAPNLGLSPSGTGKQLWNWVPYPFSSPFSSTKGNYSALPTENPTSNPGTDYEDSEDEHGGVGGRRKNVKLSKLRKGRRRSGTMEAEEGLGSPNPFRGEGSNSPSSFNQSSSNNSSSKPRSSSGGSKFFPWFSRSRRRSNSNSNSQPTLSQTIEEESSPLISSNGSSPDVSPAPSPALGDRAATNSPPLPPYTPRGSSGRGLNEEVDRFLKEMEPKVVITPPEDEEERRGSGDP